MNTLHSTDALFLANAHLDALRSSARAEEGAAAGPPPLPRSGHRWLTRVLRRPLPTTRDVRQNTSERPSEVFCPSC